MDSGGDDLAVTGADVESLAAKLDAIGEQLSDRERAVLLGVLNLAGASIHERAADPEVETYSAGFPVASFQTTPVLGDGLRSAFRPFVAGGTSSFAAGGTSIILTGGFGKI